MTWGVPYPQQAKPSIVYVQVPVVGVPYPFIRPKVTLKAKILKWLKHLKTHGWVR